jgi:hypothetical protein
MGNCGKCGEQFGFLSGAYVSEKVYPGVESLSLNERYPDNPYRGMRLCERCYKEVYENAPTLPIKKTPSTIIVAKGNGMMLREIVSFVFVLAFVVEIIGLLLLEPALGVFAGGAQVLIIIIILAVGFSLVALSYWVLVDGREIENLRQIIYEHTQGEK